jgi:hypothetical protein
MFARPLLISALLLGILSASAQAQTQPLVQPPASGQASPQPAAPPPNFFAKNIDPEGAQPVVSAMSYSPIPPGSSFDTQANDDTAMDHDTVERVNAGLAERGYKVAPSAPYVMIVEADLVRSARQDSPGYGQGYGFSTDGGTRFDRLGYGSATDSDRRYDGRLYSKSQTSLLNPNPPVDTSNRTYRISLSVYDRQSGLYVWRGSVNRSDPNLDVNQASVEMVAALLTHLGQTVK